ncbi:carboxypeptidase-like regulatory domain-containing protein [Nonlabens sp.]|uniref:carboxypeptidase-like regulatory domain-containing protein n=1 Tax=Nonlabens sp. TaxID=1888209 RepID=UPI0032644462
MFIHFNKQQVIILLAVFLLLNFAASQEIVLKGQVTDSLLNPIENTTIYSKSLGEEEGLLFSISDIDGNYKLKLSKDKSYVITISYLGYNEIKDTVILKNDLVKNYILKESAESLDEIILRKKLAVSVKKDTITYRTDQFTDGTERKLRDILKKLPGLDVDREGNVKVNGKDVTKLMVDGKDFFNGDEKLGVNNIPADAIDEVVALDNYSKIPWLKGLTDSDELALNIKLKDGKRNFVFGDVNVGAGIEDRYKISPLLFYYSPKTAVNFIGDVNNTGVRSFTTSDYLNFEMGNSTLLNDYSKIGETLNDEVARSLSNADFQELKTLFGAFNLNHDFDSGLNITAYTINNGNSQKTMDESIINYLIEDDFTETRSDDSEQDASFTANTVKLNYTTSNDLDVLGRIDFKDFSSDLKRNLLSTSPQSNQFNSTIQETTDFTFSPQLNLNKRFNSKHISTLETSFKIEDRSYIGINLFDQPIFLGIVPLITQESGVFNVNQFSDRKTTEFKLGIKHYYVINSTTHLYPLTGFNISNTNYTNTDSQLLDDGSINSFQNDGFNNDLSGSIEDYYLGFQLKKKYGNYIIKPGLVAHLYEWNARQLENDFSSKSKLVPLPELSVEYEPSSSRKLRFKYQMNSRFANPINFANRLRINSFNQITRGNENLDNSLYHNFSLGYQSFKLLEGTLFNASLSYSRFIEGIRNGIAVDGVNQIQTLIQTDLPENTYNGRLNYSTYLWNMKWSYKGNINMSDYKRIVNESVLDYRSAFISNSIEVGTRFKKSPNFEIEIGHQSNNLEGSNISNNFENWTSVGAIDFNFLKSFLFTADYELNYFTNNSAGQTNDFNTVNASLEYWKESSAWSFKIEAINLLNNEIKLSSNLSQFQASESRVFVQPRILFFSVTYKL